LLVTQRATQVEDLWYDRKEQHENAAKPH
jgi:hypothetical protein